MGPKPKGKAEPAGGDKKKKGPPKPECIPPAVVDPIKDMSLEYYMMRLSDYEHRVELYVITSPFYYFRS